jgi:hypothetical protein
MLASSVLLTGGPLRAGAANAKVPVRPGPGRVVLAAVDRLWRYAGGLLIAGAIAGAVGGTLLGVDPADRGAGLPPGRPLGVVADVISLRMAPPWAWSWLSPEARRQEGPPEPTRS